MKVPLLDLNAQYQGIVPAIKAEMDKVIAANQYILGPVVKEFEEQMTAYLNCGQAVGCASGTDALILALLALNIGPDDEVITTPFTFFATASSIHRVGAKPVFADIDPLTFNLDPSAVEKCITPRTKAIMPVHLFGQAANMDAFMDLAKKYNLHIIEDNAQGIGCLWNNKAAGTFGDIGTLSFFPSKNLGAMGDGGMCVTNDANLAANLRQLRVHGENPKYFHRWVGLNSRLDSLQAAVLKVKLNHLRDWSKARRRNAEIYDTALTGIKQVQTPFIDERAYSIYNQYTIRAERRDELQQYLQDNGIGCAVYYPLPLHLQECFAYLGYKAGDMPHSEKSAQEVLSLPIYGELEKEQIDFVVQTIRKFYAE